MKLHIDIETFCGIDIKTAGVYKYTAHPSFEITLAAFSVDGAPVEVYDLKADGWAERKQQILWMLANADEIHAHNAVFEREAFRNAWKFESTPAQKWHCSAVLASSCGLPLSLADVSDALELEEEGKMSEGKALIRYFCVPCKPTKTNMGRVRNLPEHAPDKWELFKKYCVRDVIAEVAICIRLEKYPMAETLLAEYELDYQINRRGVRIDLPLVASTMKLDAEHKEAVTARLQSLTGLGNPNSGKQFGDWLAQHLGYAPESLDKEHMEGYKKQFAGSPEVFEVLGLKSDLGKTSVSKYEAMQDCAGVLDRARGLVQFLGAGRTGRWAGRLVQVQNLPQNHLQHLDLARRLVRDGDLQTISDFYPSVPDVLSQLIRTAIIPYDGDVFVVADFSAIEARVLAWIAGEQWRLDEFAGEGRIYEASAAKMFGLQKSEIKKGSDLRQKGKIAELALGYAGGVGALKAMGADKMGLSDSELQGIVTAWREASPAIPAFWKSLERAAVKALENPGQRIPCGMVSFRADANLLSIRLPSGRCLRYWGAELYEGKYGKATRYKGKELAGWGWVDTYGGKLCENIVQAISRDLLAETLAKADRLSSSQVVMHVHDEVVLECHKPSAERILSELTALMSVAPAWAEGLPLRAEGFICDYYQK